MKTLLPKVFGFTIVILLLNPRPLISDAQMWTGAENVTPREPSELRWFCVPAEQVTVEQTEMLSDGAAVSMPQIQIDTPAHHYEVSLSGSVQGDYDAIFAQWQELVQHGRKVCVEIEFLQSLESVNGTTNSLWLIHQLKSERGEWTPVALNE